MGLFRRSAIQDDGACQCAVEVPGVVLLGAVQTEDDREDRRSAVQVGLDDCGRVHVWRFTFARSKRRMAGTPMSPEVQGHMVLRLRELPQVIGMLQKALNFRQCDA